VLQGTDERVTHVTQGSGLAAAIPGARLVLAKGSGHVMNARDPVLTNLLLRDFVRSLDAPDGGPAA
jgi:pimeloyl-ACP methyl ester carboxylesterase